MITVKRATNPAYSRGNLLLDGDQTPMKQPIGSKVGTTSRKVQADSKAGFKSESLGIPTGAPNTQVGYNMLSIDLDPMLQGITPEMETLIHPVYRDMYYMDPVAGSAVDLISNLPFSEFTLGGVQDKKMLSSYMEAIERLNIRTLLPEISIDYLVHGAHISSMLYNTEKKAFTEIVPHAAANCTITPLPFYSQDPIIKVKFPKEVTTALSMESKRLKRIREMVGAKIFDQMKEGEIELDPLNSLYIPRRTFSDQAIGTSYYKRLLPIYLIEKNLTRGTMVESARRQRGIMHITAGDGDQWDPTPQDLDAITEIFMNADSDPLGAIVTTKLGIAIEEIRQGGDFWKSTDFADQALNIKLRALGVSEAFLSGDANWNTADTSLSVFIDFIRSYRDMITRKLFYNKLFPLISVINGYTVNTKGKLVMQHGLIDKLSSADIQDVLNDGSRLLIPTVNWSKQLKPEGDGAYLDMLNTLTEKGVPVPLRVMAAAGGMNLDELLRQQEDDLEVRKSIADYMKKIQALMPKQPEEGSDMEAEAAAISTVLASVDPNGKTRSAVLASRGHRPSLMSRDFGTLSEVKGRSKTGKARLIVDQRAANEKINRNLVRAMREANRAGRM